MAMPRTSSRGIIRLHADDNVVVAVDNLVAGDWVSSILVGGRVPRGHKVATVPISKGMPIRKFGQIIGVAQTDIPAGEWVHEHNIAFDSFERDYAIASEARPLQASVSDELAEFQGYRRSSGKFGTRNYLGILTSVNCSATVARLIAREAERLDLLAEYPQVDGIIPLVHGTGCAMDDHGEGYEVLKRTQWGYAANPNMGGVLMVGLGCEAFQIGRWKQAYGIAESETFRSFTIQDAGGTRAAVESGLAAIRDMLPIVNAARREPCPASELILALQCGGSDGYSGITANPALGAAVDLLVGHGGTAILSETPEIYGAEHLLTRRAANVKIGNDLIELICWWENYTKRNGAQLNNNPSPGNKAGGLSTILEKSLGAVAKGGTTTLQAVYRYAEPVTAKGFVFMDTPGYYPVSATGQVAGGANLLAFTTGRGSAYGCKPTPSIKLASNTPMFERMREDMDINCGDVLDGVSIEQKGLEIFQKMLAVASGEQSKSELNGYGDAEFVPWQIGATL
ncbi:altronate dehydratase [Bradyrhizobium sp. 61]|uniref:UxaA family hydrolase n=1 Tax=unclassified Bradyrhizobium TaxID=2631580 RepID=UPI001FFB9ED8|nr:MULTISPECIES: altronate dehydratase family protein [unclassified Bradyrhizobium]MCK1281838.1 altronate dehydratase [Bradyrhizobium sp. 61]MCK1459735.1 altronate dehydratase [Bradyrhizobium sp. 2]